MKDDNKAKQTEVSPAQASAPPGTTAPEESDKALAAENRRLKQRIAELEEAALARNRQRASDLEDLRLDNATLKRRVAELEESRQQAGADEVEIRKRQSKGLTREQAEAAVRNQRAYEARKARRNEKGSK